MGRHFPYANFRYSLMVDSVPQGIDSVLPGRVFYVTVTVTKLLSSMTLALDEIDVRIRARFG